jgi:hypothetical protein
METEGKYNREARNYEDKELAKLTNFVELSPS